MNHREDQGEIGRRRLVVALAWVASAWWTLDLYGRLERGWMPKRDLGVVVL